MEVPEPLGNVEKPAKMLDGGLLLAYVNKLSPLTQRRLGENPAS